MSIVIYFKSKWFCDSQLRLQLLQDTQSARRLNALGVVVLGSVGDLAVVDDDGEAAGALVKVPADAAGELGVLVGHEELFLRLCQYGVR